MRRIVVPILMVCTFVTVLGMTSLEEYFYRTRPKTPDVTAARVYPEDVKSFQGVARVYLTRTETLPFEWMPYWRPVLVGAVIITACILVIQRRRHSTQSQR
jgi:hypothetical protein